MHITPVTTGAMTFREYLSVIDNRRENLTFYLKDEENDEYVEAPAPPEYKQYWLDQKTAGSSAVALIPEPVWDSLLRSSTGTIILTESKLPSNYRDCQHPLWIAGVAQVLCLCRLSAFCDRVLKLVMFELGVANW